MLPRAASLGGHRQVGSGDGDHQRASVAEWSGLGALFGLFLEASAEGRVVTTELKAADLPVVHGPGHDPRLAEEGIASSSRSRPTSGVRAIGSR